MSSMTNATPESRTGNCWTDGKPDTKYPTGTSTWKTSTSVATKHTLVNITGCDNTLNHTRTTK